MGVVGRAIERVDDPAKARVATHAGAALLAEDGVGREGGEQPGRDLVLALHVHVGDKIECAFVAHFADGVDAAA